MTPEEKELLLKDLCARLLYGVKVCVLIHEDDPTSKEILTLNGFDGHSIYKFWIYDEEKLAKYGCCGRGLQIDEVRPYLRPMSSMTEEERDEYNDFTFESASHFGFAAESCELIDWLNKKMFDYRGLIPMGLALEALANMYNF